jgi:predicted component of type VI protein secretion system
MSVDFQRGDLVQMPGDEASLGRVVEIRDYGIEIWVQPLDESRPQYYTYYDQLESMNPLDRIVREIERSDSATTFYFSNTGRRFTG